MSSYQIGGIIWILAAVLAVATTVVFRENTAAWVVTNVASVIAAIIGVLFIWRPSHRLVRGSMLGGVVWVLLYAALVIIQAADIQAWTADAFLGAVGGVAAFVTYRARTREGGAESQAPTPRP